MFGAIYKSADDLIEWDWPKYEPYFTDLAGRSLSADGVDDWLEDWSKVNDCLDEQGNRLYVATAVNTTDTVAQQRSMHLSIQFTRRLSSLTKAQTDAAGQRAAAGRFRNPLRNLRAEADLFRSENLPLLAEEIKLTAQYDQVVGAQTVPVGGQELTPAQLTRCIRILIGTYAKKPGAPPSNGSLPTGTPSMSCGKNYLLYASDCRQRRKPDYRLTAGKICSVSITPPPTAAASTLPSSRW